MSNEGKIQRSALWMVLLLAIGASGGYYFWDEFGRDRENLPVIATLPNFNLTERSGESFGLSKLHGKINVVNFFFTTCTMICPTMNGKMANLYSQFSNSEKVQFVSITVDPAQDSLAVLQKYAEQFGVTDNRWSFLRGTQEQTMQLAEKGFMLSGSIEHSGKLVLIDKSGAIRGYYDYNDDAQIETLEADIAILLHSQFGQIIESK